MNRLMINNNVLVFNFVRWQIVWLNYVCEIGNVKEIDASSVLKHWSQLSDTFIFLFEICVFFLNIFLMIYAHVISLRTNKMTVFLIYLLKIWLLLLLITLIIRKKNQCVIIFWNVYNWLKQNCLLDLCVLDSMRIIDAFIVRCEYTERW